MARVRDVCVLRVDGTWHADDALQVDIEHDPTLMLECALNGARSGNHSSKPGAIVHRVIMDNT
eukprot:5052385-Prymnesium_polylepis.1